MMLENRRQKAAHVLGRAALILLLCILAPIALCALRYTVTSLVADNRMNQAAIVFSDSLLPNLALTCAAALGMAGLLVVFDRFFCVRAAAVAAWLAASVCFVLAVGLVPRADSALVLDAAARFARNDFSPMHSVYFNRVSYQLGICLPLELLARLLPGADLNLVMQGINCLLGAGTALAFSALAGLLDDHAQTGRAALLLYLLFVPMLLFNMFVYGVLPMVFLCALAMLCFARYTQTGKRRFGLMYALLIGAAMVLKPNTMIIMLALLICAALHALERKDGFLLLCALLSAALCAALPAGVIRLYELRSGVTLAADTGMLLRLAMGMQDSVIAAGWYNGMIEEFWDLSIMPQEEAAAAAQMLGQRLGEFCAEPGMAAQFFAEKCLTQWLEPAYDMIWYGAACEKGGRFNGLAHMVFREGSSVRAALEGYLNLFQQMMYAFFVLGLWRMIRRRRCSAAQLMLPVAILGGFFYHMLFEAKSQYLYMYIMMMMPLAAQGLAALANRIKTH